MACIFVIPNKKDFQLKDCKAKSKDFSAEEDDFLKNFYPTMGLSEELLKNFPNRTIGSITQRVSRLGIKYTGVNKHNKKGATHRLFSVSCAFLHVNKLYYYLIKLKD